MLGLILCLGGPESKALLKKLYQKLVVRALSTTEPLSCRNLTAVIYIK